MPSILEVENELSPVRIAAGSQTITAYYRTGSVSTDFLEKADPRPIHEALCDVFVRWDLTCPSSRAKWLRDEHARREKVRTSETPLPEMECIPVKMPPAKKNEPEEEYPLIPFALAQLPQKVLNMAFRALLDDQLPNQTRLEDSETSF